MVTLFAVPILGGSETDVVYFTGARCLFRVCPQKALYTFQVK